MITELSYNVKNKPKSQVKKSPTAIASYLLAQQSSLPFNDKPSVSFGPLINGRLVNLKAVGLELENKLRKEFSAACKLLHKKKKVVFFLNKEEVVVFHCTPAALKKEVYKGYIAGVKKIGSLTFEELFEIHGIKKGGKSAFYMFLNKLTAYNNLHAKKRAVGAIMYKQHVPIVFLTYEMFGIKEQKVKDPIIEKEEEVKEIEQEEEEEEKVPPPAKIIVPKVKIKIPKTSTIMKFKKALQPLKIDGASSAELKSTVAKELSVDAALLKVFQADKKRTEAFANTSIKEWANSSSGHGSAYMQIAVANLASLKPTHLDHFVSRVKTAKFKKNKWAYVPMNKNAETYEYDYETHNGQHEFADRHPEEVLNKTVVLAQAIYRKTQKFLANKGVKELVLFRGMHPNKNFSHLDKTKPIKATIKLNPLSSFSTDLEEAESFGSHIIAAVIPAKRIFSCARTGHGCWGEQEFVVIGGRIRGYIVNREKWVPPSGINKIEEKLEMLEEKESNIEDKITELDNNDGMNGVSNAKKIEKLQKKLILVDSEIHKLRKLLMKEENEDDLENYLKTKFLKTAKASIEPSEPVGQEQEVDADEGDNANWTKTTLDGLPLVGSREFMEYVAKSGKTMEQVLASTPYRLAHIKFAPVVMWLKRMANTLDAEQATVRARPIDQIKPSLCHLATVKAIAERMNLTDKIWFFGDNDGKHPQVFHSLLTNRKNKVIANNYRGVGSLPTQFNPTLGYKTPAGEHLPVLDKVTVREFIKKYFKS